MQQHHENSTGMFPRPGGVIFTPPVEATVGVFEKARVLGTT